MKKIFTEYYSPQKNIYFCHAVDYLGNDKIIPQAQSYSQYEILYIISGEAEQTINENRYLASAGDLIIVNTQQLHKIQVNLAHSDYERYILRFSPKMFYLENENLKDIFNLFLFTKNKAFTIFKKFETEQMHLLDYFKKFEKLSMQNNDECTFIQMLSAILDLSTTIYKQQKLDVSPSIQLYANEHIRAIIDYVSKNIRSNITLEKISKDLFLNPYYISHLFSKHMGMSLKKYINNMKIYYAEELIEAGESPTAIAYMLGFNYYSTFFNAYKRVLGKIPTTNKNEQPQNKNS